MTNYINGYPNRVKKIFRTHSNLGVPVVKPQIFEVSGATAD